MRRGGGRKVRALSLESLPSLGLEGRSLGRPRNLPGRPGPLGVFQKFVQKKFVRIFLREGETTIKIKFAVLSGRGSGGGGG